MLLGTVAMVTVGRGSLILILLGLRSASIGMVIMRLLLRMQERLLGISWVFITFLLKGW